MKQAIRFFAIGLLVSSVLLFGYYTYFNEETKPEVITEELSTEEMIEQVEAEGFKIITNEQYIALTVTSEPEDTENTEESDKKQDESTDSKSSEKEKVEDEAEDEDLGIITHTFVTEDGVLSTDIADILVDNKIIDDRQAFLTFLEENDYMKYIQLGEFTVSNDMSFEDIADIVTTYPGN